MEMLLSLARQAGFSQLAELDAAVLKPLTAVRDMCSADKCRSYGKSWSCPPACGSIEYAARQARLLFPGCLPLSSGTCSLCRKCTYPDRPCRFPGKRLSSMEAFGLLVSDVCQKSGLPYYYGPKTITFTACILTD